MSERKVLNKYFPPDFDPSLIPRRRQPKNSQQVVRLMAPFSMRCNTCGEYIYKGKKFNARKETVEGEDYFGIKIFRFYIKWQASFDVECPTLCSAEITFKTDPKNTDYAAEHGASRNFEPWRDERAVEEEDRLSKLEEEENNPMKALENRTVDSKREMDILDALQDIRARNARNERVGQSVDLLDRLHMEEIENEEDLEQKRAEEEDEKLVREVFAKVPAADTSVTHDAGLSEDVGTSHEVITVKRKAGADEPDLQSLLSESARALLAEKSSKGAPPFKRKRTSKNLLGIKVTGKNKVKAV
ncbi:CWC16 protein [Trametes gibbosa]|nr:CWC16 protein [Trametes gibbosa]